MSDHLEPDGGKRCTRCGQCKPYDQYPRRRRFGRAYIEARCKQCANELRRRWARDNPERHRKIKRASAVKRAYGITGEQLLELIDQQGGVDPITLEPIGFRDDVDHDHTTGRVRGVLKAKTNRALGLLADCPTRLFRAIGYLQRHGFNVLAETPPRTADGQTDKQ